MAKPERHRVTVGGMNIRKDRLVLRPWSLQDAGAALAVYSRSEVARCLAPAMDAVADESAMTAVLKQWIDQCSTLEALAGRWAVELADSGELIGGAAVLPLPQDGVDLEIGWQLAPAHWGQGLAHRGGPCSRPLHVRSRRRRAVRRRTAPVVVEEGPCGGRDPGGRRPC